MSCIRSQRAGSILAIIDQRDEMTHCPRLRNNGFRSAATPRIPEQGPAANLPNGVNSPSLVFRQIPGKLAPRRRQTQPLRRFQLRSPPLNAVASSDSGFLARHFAWVFLRRAAWHSGLLQGCCRDLTRGPGWNQWRQMEHGLFRGAGIVHHHRHAGTSFSAFRSSRLGQFWRAEVG